MTGNGAVSRDPEVASSCDTLSGSEEQNNTAHVWVGLDSLKDLFAHDGSSFYLRTGALGRCLNKC